MPEAVCSLRTTPASARRRTASRIVFITLLLQVHAAWCAGLLSEVIRTRGEVLATSSQGYPAGATGDPLLLRSSRHACGNWHSRYARLHARIRQEKRGRYMFHQCDEGQADCFAGMVSALYLAIISKRAFFTGKYSYQYFFEGRSSGHLSAAFEQPFIDWDIPPDLFRKRFHESAHVMLQGMHASELSRRKIRKVYDMAMGKEEDAITIFSNAGILHHLFEIPGFRMRMEERLGVSFEDAFGCALDFLFWPKNDFKYALENEEILRSTVSKGNPVIGMHLRSGDAVFKTGRGLAKDFEEVRKMFRGAVNCVEDLQKHVVLQHGVQAILLILSDDMFVRRAMAQIFPDYVVVYNDVVKPEHTGPFQSSGISAQGLQTAAIEFWMFGATDYQITSKSSGFGRAAAARTLPSKPMHMFVLEDYAKLQSCGPADEVSFQDLARLLPGL